MYVTVTLAVTIAVDSDSPVRGDNGGDGRNSSQNPVERVNVKGHSDSRNPGGGAVVVALHANGGVIWSRRRRSRSLHSHNGSSNRSSLYHKGGGEAVAATHRIAEAVVLRIAVTVAVMHIMIKSIASCVDNSRSSVHGGGAWQLMAIACSGASQ